MTRRALVKRFRCLAVDVQRVIDCAKEERRELVRGSHPRAVADVAVEHLAYAKDRIAQVAAVLELEIQQKEGANVDTDR